MDKVITLLFWKRPKYVRQVLDHLSQCRGIDAYHLVVHLDGPANKAVRELCHAIKFAPHETRQFHQNHGCNQCTRTVLRRGFDLSDYVIHVEEDVLLAPDALQYFEWARQFGPDKTLLNVSGIRHPTGWLFEHGHFPDGQAIEQKAKRSGGFTCWGWATWKDRWQELDKIWSTEPDRKLSWDVRIEQYRRQHKLAELMPLVSRVQNIGAEQGTHRGEYVLSYWAGSPGFVTPSKYQAIA